MSAGSPPDLTRNDTGGPITTGSGAPTARDASAVIELYALQYGRWRRFVSMGTDPDSATLPLSNQLAPGVTVASGSAPGAAHGPTFLDVFARGSDGQVYWRWTSARGEPSWGAWQDLGGSAASSPGATYVDDRVVVGVRRSNGEIWLADESNEFAWASAGAPSANAASGPALVSPSQDTLYLFVRGGDGALWYRKRIGTTWDAWRSLGGSIRGTPAAVSRFVGHIDVFTNSPTGDLKQIWADGASWAAWVTVPNGSCCLKADSGPAAAEPNANRLDVFVRGNDDRIWWKTWTSAGQWTSWRPIGGVLRSNPAATSRGTIRVDVFAVADNGGLWHRRHGGRTQG